MGVSPLRRLRTEASNSQEIGDSLPFRSPHSALRTPHSASLPPKYDPRKGRDHRQGNKQRPKRDERPLGRGHFQIRLNTVQILCGSCATLILAFDLGLSRSVFRSRQGQRHQCRRAEQIGPKPGRIGKRTSSGHAGIISLHDVLSRRQTSGDLPHGDDAPKAVSFRLRTQAFSTVLPTMLQSPPPSAKARLDWPTAGRRCDKPCEPLLNPVVAQASSPHGGQ